MPIFYLFSGYGTVVLMSEYFPYEFRFNQERVMKKIMDYVETGGTILFHAPTGYGKTVVVLAALLPYAIDTRTPVLWSVRTGNETDRPIEELKVISDKLGKPIYGISIRGKRDMCLLAREKGITDYEGVSVLCERMRKKCRFFENLRYYEPSVGMPKTFSELLSFCMENKICPYFYQLRSASKAILVAASYNYVFSQRFKWALRAYMDYRGSILVVDEAHNLQQVMAQINSDKITIGTVERAINELKNFRTRNAINLLNKVISLKNVLIEEGRKILGEDDVFDPQEIVDKVGINEKDFDNAWKIVSKIYSRKLAEGKSPRSSLRHLFSFLRTALENARSRGVAFIKYREKNQYAFEVWDMRAAEILRRMWRMFHLRILMSGTLKPFKAFAEIVGIKRFRSISGTFPIPRENVLALILENVTTKGEELPDKMRKRYIKYLTKIIQSINKNTAVFFASYRIMNELTDEIIKQIKNRKAIVEREGMRGEEAKKTVEIMKKEKGIVLFANMSGRFAEGIDLPGEALEAIILVGIPFERLTVRTTIYMEYYKEIYGIEKGIYYSYVLPALRRASQAMGRAIRSTTDRAIIIAADERYAEKQNIELLPKYFTNNSKVVSIKKALELISLF